MRNHVYSVIAFTVLTAISLMLLFFLKKTAYDIVLAIFGSSFVSLIISLIGYFTSRKDTLEDFYESVSKRLHYWTLYDPSDSIDKKCEFFINYYIKDFSDIGRAYSKIFFLFDFKHRSRNRIYDKIYQPCMNLNDSIVEHYWNFKWHIDGTGRNENVMNKYISEIENIMIDKKTGTDFIIQINEELNTFLIKMINAI